MRNIWPARIRLRNDSLQPYNTDVLDADTGLAITFVLDVHIHIGRHEMQIEAIGATDDPPRYAVNAPPDPDVGELDFSGVVADRKTYYVTRLDIEGA